MEIKEIEENTEIKEYQDYVRANYTPTSHFRWAVMKPSSGVFIIMTNYMNKNVTLQQQWVKDEYTYWLDVDVFKY